MQDLRDENATLNELYEVAQYSADKLSQRADGLARDLDAANKRIAELEAVGNLRQLTSRAAATTPAGSTGWQSGGLAAGAATANLPAAATNGNPGWWQLGTGTTAGGRAWAFLGNSGLAGAVIVGNARPQGVEWNARIPTVSAGGETFFCSP